ncbi:muscarinic acetylcholine receptor M4-like [Mya arenaria]|uniref:muscarinic acetylcholine receptor M4-like n=1 Tax=Mya arenaria TaxID=6604 RepID=UPI0022E5CCCC|nr:muscarinic acetylcholine receptor M4-like [Mya arenaria]XP_052766390.1 muscarinic acetylcholine receptor M4-like [Mya arenaria]
MSANMNGKTTAIAHFVALNDTLKNRSLEIDETALTESMNLQQFQFQLPAIIYTIILMVIGTPGNIIVLYVYFFKWRKSTSRMFILFLTSLDLFNCVTTLPMEIFIMRYSVMLDRPWLCKISRFSTYTMNSSSAAILVAIAVDRYRRICRPHGPQFSAKASKYISICCIVLALCLTWPSLLFYGTRSVKLENVEGKSCLLENKFDESVYPHVFFVLMMASTVIIFTTLSVLYYFVGIQVCRHRRMRMKRKREQKAAQNLMIREPTDSKDDTLLQDSDSKGEIKNTTEKTENRENENNKNVYSIEHRTQNHIELLPLPVGTTKNDLSIVTLDESTVNSDGKHTVRSTPDVQRKSKSGQEGQRHNKNGVSKTNGIMRDSLCKSNGSQCIHIRVHIGRSTLMLFLITLAYIASFLPFYVIAIIRQTDSTFVSNMNNAGYMAYHVCLRSYLLSSAINPIIYSFCNSQFRTFCFNMIKKHKRLSSRKSLL